VDKLVILIASKIYAGFGEFTGCCELAKNAPEGTSDPQAWRSSRPGCANLPSGLQSPIGSVVRSRNTVFLPWYHSIVIIWKPWSSHIHLQPGAAIHPGF